MRRAPRAKDARMLGDSKVSHQGKGLFERTFQRYVSRWFPAQGRGGREWLAADLPWL